MPGQEANGYNLGVFFFLFCFFYLLYNNSKIRKFPLNIYKYLLSWAIKSIF